MQSMTQDAKAVNEAFQTITDKQISRANAVVISFPVVKETFYDSRGKPFATILQEQDTTYIDVPNVLNLFLLPGEEVVLAKSTVDLNNAFIITSKNEPVAMDVSFSSISGTTLALAFTSPYDDVDLEDYIGIGLAGRFYFSKTGQDNQELEGTITNTTYADVGGYNVATTTIELEDFGLVIDTTWSLFSTYLGNVFVGGTDADAIHDNVASEISAITEKTSPISADMLLIEDSAANNAKKMVQISNLHLVASTTLTATTATISFTGLDLNADGGIYDIILAGVASGVTAQYYYIEYNGNATSTTYRSIRTFRNVSTETTISASDARAGRLGNLCSTNSHIITLPNSYPNCITNGTDYYTTGGIGSFSIGQIYYATLSNITSVDLQMISGSFGIGTTVNIFKRS